MRYLNIAIITTSLALLLNACSSSTPVQPSKKVSALPSIAQHNHSHSHQHQPISKGIPQSFLIWLGQGNNKQQVESYYAFLQHNGVADIVPMYELLRTARAWQECGRDQYAVPSSELWHNSISTLKVFSMLKKQKILTDFEVTSVYRDENLNQCAGGAKSSKHLFNSAIDFRLGSEYPQPSEFFQIEQSKAKLCHFWAKHGELYNMGIGVYRSGQIHIDTQGFRTWGPELTRESSPCYYEWLSLNPPTVTY